jgi:anthranilate synthase/aminodeoxychorismate synthase-like glutamine amidotransferase
MNVKVVLVDFYDSFTFNLVHYFEQLGAEVTVIRHDYLNLTDLNEFDAVVLSPGPGLPNEKKNLAELLAMYVGKKPILGVCLGMQAIALHLGARLENQQVVKHGVQEKLLVKDQSVLFQGLPSEFLVGLYHSWKVVDLPNDCQTAQLDNGVAMSLEFPKLRLFAVQFHPESILTEHGLPLLANFLNCAQL